MVKIKSNPNLWHSFVTQDQQKALELLKTDPNLKDLQVLESPLFDLEIRGVPALKFMGDVVWK